MANYNYNYSAGGGLYRYNDDIYNSSNMPVYSYAQMGEMERQHAENADASNYELGKTLGTVVGIGITVVLAYSLYKAITE